MSSYDDLIDPTAREMDREISLFVLSQLADGRSVEPRLEVEARAYADGHPEVYEALADIRTMGAALADEPARTASLGFTDRVLLRARAEGLLAEAVTTAPSGPGKDRREREPGGAGGRIIPMVWKLGLAAGLALAVTVGWGLSQPDSLMAEDKPHEHELIEPHAADHFVPTPEDPTGLSAGLRELLPAPRRLSDEEREELLKGER